MYRLLPSKLDKFIVPPGVFRLLLAVAVVFSHTTRAHIGRLAVLFFFYLSGYWTIRIYKEKFDGRAALRFYAARYLRIMPLYLLTVIATALFVGRALRPDTFALLGVASTGHDLPGVTWSLDIELQFYLLLPLIAGLLASTRPWISIAATLVVGALGYWLAEQWHLVTVAMYLPAFVLGAVTYSTSWEPSSTWARWSVVAFAAATVLTGVMSFLGFTSFLDKDVQHFDVFNQDIWSFLWMIPLLPYIARSLTIRSNKLDRDLGNLSYPLYLIHLPIIWYLRAHWGDSAAIKGLAIIVSCILAIGIYLAIDRPIDALRVRLTERHIPRRPSPMKTQT